LKWVGGVVACSDLVHLCSDPVPPSSFLVVAKVLHLDLGFASLDLVRLHPHLVSLARPVGFQSFFLLLVRLGASVVLVASTLASEVFL
jgi:hypothetical protein